MPDGVLIRTMQKVGIPIFDSEFRVLLVNGGFPAAMAYLISRHGLDTDEAKAAWDWLERALRFVTGG